MKLTFTADWTQPTADTDRLAIAGYTAVIEAVPATDMMGRPVTGFEFTILRDHFEIVEVGVRSDRGAARQAVEVIIALHAEALQQAAV